jgi:hypothetical protein
LAASRHHKQKPPSRELSIGQGDRIEPEARKDLALIKTLRAQRQAFEVTCAQSEPIDGSIEHAPNDVFHSDASNGPFNQAHGRILPSGTEKGNGWVMRGQVTGNSRQEAAKTQAQSPKGKTKRQMTKAK